MGKIIHKILAVTLSLFEFTIYLHKCICVTYLMGIPMGKTTRVLVLHLHLMAVMYVSGKACKITVGNHH